MHDQPAGAAGEADRDARWSAKEAGQLEHRHGGVLQIPNSTNSNFNPLCDWRACSVAEAGRSGDNNSDFQVRLLPGKLIRNRDVRPDQGHAKGVALVSSWTCFAMPSSKGDVLYEAIA